MSSDESGVLVWVQAHDCAATISAALESIVWLVQRDLHLVMVDDGSSDTTAALAAPLLEQYFDGCHVVHRHARRQGLVPSLHAHLDAAPAAAIVVLLDGSEQFLTATLLQEVARRHHDGANFTWTTLQGFDGQDHRQVVSVSRAALATRLGALAPADRPDRIAALFELQTFTSATRLPGSVMRRTGPAARPTPPAHAAPAAAPLQNSIDRARAQWTQAAMETLYDQCPSLAELDRIDAPSPATRAVRWQWWRWLARGPACPRVLEIGTGPFAATLHALVASLGGTTVSVGADRDSAASLQSNLDTLGLTGSMVFHASLVEAEFEELAGEFPDIGSLPDELAGFDLAVISADAGPLVGETRLALPMLVPRLRSTGFRLCLWSPAAQQPLHSALSMWNRIAPDLTFSSHPVPNAGIVIGSGA
ncbi:hypothetical protein BH10PSE17_BH10PSE17_11730 [soil metagenome]